MENFLQTRAKEACCEYHRKSGKSCMSCPLFRFQKCIHPEKSAMTQQMLELKEKRC